MRAVCDTALVPVRAVVFDLFITLTDFDAERCRPRYTDELAEAMGVDRIGFASLIRETFTERVTGRLGDPQATFTTMARRLGRELSAEQLDGVMALRRDQTRRTLTPRAGVLDALAGLRAAGYPTGILTDCTGETPALWPSLPYAGVVDAVTFSCEIGQRKPHAGGYHDIARKLGVATAQCLYVGDGSSSELTGAEAVGMTAAD